MSAFGPVESLGGDVGYELLRRGPVNLYYRQSVLDPHIEWLEKNDYQIVRFDAVAWSDQEAMLRDIAVALDFPPSPRHSLDGTNDWFADLIHFEWGWNAEATGLVLVFYHFDAYAKLLPESARSILDIIADHSRSAALHGRRLSCIVQSDDPTLEVRDVGASPVGWNLRESFRKNRLAAD